MSSPFSSPSSLPAAACHGEQGQNLQTEMEHLKTFNDKLLEKIKEQSKVIGQLKQKNEDLSVAIGVCFEEVTIADLKEKIGELEKSDFPVKVDAGKSKDDKIEKLRKLEQLKGELGKETEQLDLTRGQVGVYRAFRAQPDTADDLQDIFTAYGFGDSKLLFPIRIKDHLH